MNELKVDSDENCRDKSCWRPQHEIEVIGLVKSRLGLLLPFPILTFALSAALPAADPSSPSWHATSLPEAVGLVALFTVIGVALAILGYKLFDAATPGQLHREIVENRNLAAAIVGAAVIVGVCLIVAAAIVG